MISKKCLYAYREKFPGHDMFYMEPGDDLCIVGEGSTLVQPEDETDESFMDRLNRSTKERNLFLEEWPENKLDYSKVWL